MTAWTCNACGASGVVGADLTGPRDVLVRVVHAHHADRVPACSERYGLRYLNVRPAPSGSVVDALAEDDPSSPRLSLEEVRRWARWNEVTVSKSLEHPAGCPCVSCQAAAGDLDAIRRLTAELEQTEASEAATGGGYGRGNPFWTTTSAGNASASGLFDERRHSSASFLRNYWEGHR